MGWRDICRSTDERTVIASVIPLAGVGNKMPLILAKADDTARSTAMLVANLSSLPLDFVARQKIGGTTLNYFYLKQFPLVSLNAYHDFDFKFLLPRIIELTYTSPELSNWASDMGFEGVPFAFDALRRSQLKAEIDAFYARMYGLTREELRYVLDPADVMGDDYPSETFRGLKSNEQKEFGEFRTQRLVLEAWDKLEAGVL
jgi:hypothetical protein